MKTEKHYEFEKAIRSIWEWADLAAKRVGPLPDETLADDFPGASVALEGATRAITRADALLNELEHERNAPQSDS